MCCERCWNKDLQTTILVKHLLQKELSGPQKPKRKGALVTTSKALVTRSDALVTSSFLLLLVRHLIVASRCFSSFPSLDLAICPRLCFYPATYPHTRSSTSLHWPICTPPISRCHLSLYVSLTLRPQFIHSPIHRPTYKCPENANNASH